MKWLNRSCVLILVATIAALALRLPLLSQRPMHTDEAVHAYKFAELLEQGAYTYDPHEYHGPTLNYLTLIPAWLTSEKDITQVSETTLRIVPVFFGILLVILVLLLKDALGKTAATIAAILTAISPAMVFYSRYYIQEMLLVCFTFAVIVFGYRYIHKRKVYWAALAGICLGLMHATKETWIIAIGAMLLALFFGVIIHSQQQGFSAWCKKELNFSHIIAGIGTAILVSALFHSSFFTNPKGIIDSFSFLSPYLSKAGGNELHIHPWYYYLKMLIFSRYGTGPIWSEGFILLLALTGIILAISKKGISNTNSNFVGFIVLYTIIMLVIYSIIPYKTPWCLLGFLHGMILLAAVGAAGLINLTRGLHSRLIVIIFLIAGSGHLAAQAYLGSYKYYADPANPYVYAHTSNDIFNIVNRIKETSAAHPQKTDMPIQVICEDNDYWPLPWYLRSFKNVLYTSKIDKDVQPTQIIIASTKLQPDILQYIYEFWPPGKKNLYVPLFDSHVELRPQVELKGYISKDLMDKFENFPSGKLKYKSVADE